MTKLRDGDWASIEDWQTLQRLVNDLLFYECQGVGVLPSNPRIGKDGGWDGKVVGEIDGRLGTHQVQSKHHVAEPQKVRDELFKDLRNKKATKKLPERPGEIQKAINNGADHLLVATVGELNVDYAAELENLDRGSLQSITVWYRERLEQRINRHPALLNTYFGLGQVCSLKVPEQYFSDTETRLATSTVGTSAAPAIAQSILSSSVRFHVIHGAGGCGKSHLLRETLREVLQRSEWTVRVLSACQQPLVAEIESGLRLAAGERCLLVVDDAERFPAKVLMELAELVNSDTRFIGLVSCRSGSLGYCQTVVQLDGRQSPAAVHEVPELSDDDLMAIARERAPTRLPEAHVVRGAIAAFDRLPFYVGLWAEAFERGGIDPSELENHYRVVVQRVTADCRNALGSIDIADLERFLAALAAATPFRLESDIPQHVANLAGVPVESAVRAIRELLQEGILRETAVGVRFSPDTVGDFLFASQLDRDTFRLRAIDTLFAHNPVGFASSLAAAGRVAGSDTVETVSRRLLLDWRGNFEGERWQWFGRFQVVEQLARFAPAEALELCREYLETEGQWAPPSDPRNKPGLINALGIVLPSVVRASRSETGRPAASKLLSLVFAHGPEQSLEKTVTDLFNPLRWSIAALTEDLRGFHSELDSGTPQTGRLLFISCAVRQVLAGLHEDNYSDGQSFVMRSQALKDLPAVREMRRSAMEVVEKLIDLGHFREALSCARAIGREAKTPGDTSSVPLAGLFGDERGRTVEKLSSVDLATLSLADLHEVDSFLWHLWARHSVPDSRLLSLLRRIPRTASLRFLQRQVSMCVIDDLETLSSAPEEDRWRWWVEQGRVDRRTDADRELASELSNEFPTPAAIVEFLLMIQREAERAGDGNYGDRTLGIWAEANASTFAAARAESRWAELNAGYRGRVDYAIASEPDLSQLASLVGHGSELHLIDRFIASVEVLKPNPSSVMRGFRVLSAHPSVEVRRRLLYSLWRAEYDLRSRPMQRLVLRCLRDYDPRFLHDLTVIYGTREEGLPRRVWRAVRKPLAETSALDREEEIALAACFEESTDFFIDLVHLRCKRLELLFGESLLSRARRLLHRLFRRARPQRPYRVFFPDHGPSEWTPARAKRYLRMVARYIDVLDAEAMAEEVLTPFHSRDPLPNDLAECILILLDDPDAKVARLARVALTSTGNDVSISQDQIRRGLLWLVSNGKGREAQMWIARWTLGMSEVDPDGVPSSLHDQISVLQAIHDNEPDDKLRGWLRPQIVRLNDRRERRKAGHRGPD